MDALMLMIGYVMTMAVDRRGGGLGDEYSNINGQGAKGRTWRTVIRGEEAVIQMTCSARLPVNGFSGAVS